MKKVVIIGAGVSGLTAGSVLVKSGKFEVILLEADARIGGRVHTQQLGSHFVENGAQNVHGEKGNVVFELAQPLNILDGGNENIKMSAGRSFVTNTGTVLSKESQDRVIIFLEKVYKWPENTKGDISVGSWITELFRKEFDDNPVKVNDVSLNPAVFDWLHRFQDNVDGTDNWFQSSLKGLNEYKECDGNSSIYWKSPACYSSLFSLILSGSPTVAPTFQPAELPEWIQLGKEVKSVKLLESTQVQVTCSDGIQITCDHVIVTVSLGVLKHSHESMFIPPLPEKKVKTIENLGIGCVNKIHIDFGRKWWPEDILGYRLLWEDSDQVENYWRSDIDEATLKKEIDGIPLWCRNILGFYSVYSHPTALISWISGPAGILMEKLNDDYVQACFMKVLKKFVPNCDIPEPIELCRSFWFTNPFTRGSYSFRQVVSETANVWAKDLAEPVLDTNGKPAICFAGEATHSHYYSTVHGAYETGVREANRILQLIA